MTHGPVIITPVEAKSRDKGAGAVRAEMEVVKPQRAPKGIKVRIKSRQVVGAISARGA